jgi:hypothetical protein
MSDLREFWEQLDASLRASWARQDAEKEAAEQQQRAQDRSPVAALLMHWDRCPVLSGHPWYAGDLRRAIAQQAALWRKEAEEYEEWGANAYRRCADELEGK